MPVFQLAGGGASWTARSACPRDGYNSLSAARLAAPKPAGSSYLGAYQ